MPATPITFCARFDDHDLASIDELATLLRLKRAQTLRLVVKDRLELIKAQGTHPQVKSEVIL